MFTIEQIISSTGGRLIGGSTDSRVTNVHFDSRQIKEGGLFVALAGGTRDGHEFLSTAGAQGAVAALVSDEKKTQAAQLPSSFSLVLVEDTEKAFQDLARSYRNRLSIPIAAITGSNGKTTTKDILAHILEGKLKVYKTYKNFNNHLGVPLSLLQISPDTEAAVLELGMNHAGEIDFLAEMVQPTYTVITNVNDAHIEFFGTREAIARAKGEILPHTSPNGFACLNLDNDLVPGLAQLNPGTTYFYHIEQEGEPPVAADITASSIWFDNAGSHFTVKTAEGEAACFMPLFGMHNISNALPGIFIALHIGLTLDEIAGRLASLEISSMRFERIDGRNGLLVINDAYNASPTSMLASVRTFLSIYPERKKVLVLGDMFELGSQEEQYHREVGEQLATMDGEFQVIAVGALARHIAEGCTKAEYFPTKEEAAKRLAAFASEDYAILLKASRGMRLEDLLGGLV
ncbi:UDP-N-acetylmuramoyl-tripeptide--D-alanyl-D-alanine ligase [Aneurinibacillus sp. Ricciae_BoGa-3]|uniref:UDP-N-acetylmuramoyl-tripeptide--D-alanyl-D- alanine ligase n=1 Tax=Aneurinibacillus sp. Ricciae_BoGa-3 TaxID=3022697 RepID=UPI00233FF7C6|nr:UDP-N-acetylmuramoyl-tripeptide--D-alanyl-D-alanine ligase [Aneurinibacillus sp. Ricciae_BoGa-3]WCK53472.1 UDP-N-acetylmuramoyl-tripeptide--D-alanyl-D-alanine ligase [Aneurinibacillus sp. Ricciae_BoGa-3]